MSANQRPTMYVPGSFLRQCDICGIRFLSSKLVRGADGKFRCTRWCAEITNLEVDKLKAQSHKRREAPPPPHATPWVRGDLAAEEAAIFQALAEKRVVDPSWAGGKREGIPPEAVWSTRGAGGPSGAGYSVKSAAWSCIYLGAVVAEARRPVLWMLSAQAKLRSLGDWLLTQQLGPTGTGDYYLAADSTAAWLGGWLRFVGFGGTLPVVCSEDVGLGCMALTRAYQATGDSRYINGAALAVGCINRMMNGDKLTNVFTSSDADGLVPWHAGMVTHRMYLVEAEG